MAIRIIQGIFTVATSLRFAAVLAAIAFAAAPRPAAAFACTITPTNIAFGNIDVTTGGSVPSTGTLNVSCSGSPGAGTKMRMCVSIDGGTASDTTSRIMNGVSPAQLRFQLYSDSARSTVWGSWPAGLYSGGFTWDVTSTGANTSASMTYYGSVLGSQQTATTGSYTSNLNLFFTYDNRNTVACPETGKGNSTASFSATATVTAACTVSATNLGFGTASFLSSNIDATNTISVSCTNGAPYNVGLNAGNGSGATVASRKLTNGGTTVAYTIYRDSGRTNVWGNTVGTDTLSGTGTGSTQSLTGYGRVPVQTTPSPATFSDTVVVTVTY